MHTELIKHQIVAYREREADQRSEALAQAAAGNAGASSMYTRAADWTALKIAELQRRLAVHQAPDRTLDDVLAEAHEAMQTSAFTWAV